MHTSNSNETLGTQITMFRAHKCRENGGSMIQNMSLLGDIIIYNGLRIS